MSIVEYKYILHKGFYVPMVPIQLKIGERWYERWAFVDTGATYSIFHPKEIEGSQINYKEGQKRFIVVGDGSWIDAYFFKFDLRIDKYKISAEIGFSERLGVGFNLIGRKDIFEYFKVCFNDRDKVITFHPLI
jgi:predicted aspartyl protease